MSHRFLSGGDGRETPRWKGVGVPATPRAGWGAPEMESLEDQYTEVLAQVKVGVPESQPVSQTHQ